jgi:hypothetical protein
MVLMPVRRIEMVQLHLTSYENVTKKLQICYVVILLCWMQLRKAILLEYRDCLGLRILTVEMHKEETLLLYT